MSSMPTNTAELYAFPRTRNLEDLQRGVDHARESQLQAAFNDAMARGISEGIARGRVEAQVEAQSLLERSQREGLEQGRAEGLAEMRTAAGALRDALAQLELQRTQFAADTEAFCVDLALTIVARMVEADSVRTEFVVNSIQSAIKTLAPENPGAIYLHPEVRERIARALPELPLRDDDSLATGSARVEAGRLLVQSSIDEAFEQIRCAVLELKANRQAAVEGNLEGGIDASDD
jgi:flagellar biosynthesis/type III secretory pathway protein FliH